MIARDYTTMMDRDDFCRECRGKGTVTSISPQTGARLTETCDMCGGHGCRTVVVLREETR